MPKYQSFPGHPEKQASVTILHFPCRPADKEADVERSREQVDYFTRFGIISRALAIATLTAAKR
jgi:hypothetical protein